MKRLDYRLIGLIFSLMLISLLVISTTTSLGTSLDWKTIMSPHVKKQLQFFLVGWIAFFTMSAFNYNRIKEWTWVLYIGMILFLVGLFFVPSIQHVHRWYKIGGLTFQPSEYAKLICVIALSWFLDRSSEKIHTFSTTVQALAIVALPFFLIFKQPDLGTALALFPITLVLFYFGEANRRVVKAMGGGALIGITFMSLLYLGVIDRQQIRPVATKFLKEYQFERINPDTYHQRAAQTAIALGGVTGLGWHKSEYAKRQFLPAASTDSVFPAYAEEFGLVGVIFLLGIFFGLLYVSFQVAILARDPFGRLLAAGIAIYLGIHIVVNMGMMCGFLPITGVPLLLVSYGGSSTLATMTALGLLHSIYRRRFTF